MKRSSFLFCLVAVALLFAVGKATASLPKQVVLIYPKAPTVKLVKGCHWSNGSTKKTINAKHPYRFNFVNLAPKPHRLRRAAGFHIAMPDWPLARYEAIGFEIRAAGSVTMTTCSGKVTLTIVLS